MSVEAAVFVGVERQHPNSTRQHRRTRPHRSTASPCPVDIAAVISVGRVGEEAEDRARSRTSSRVDLVSHGLVNLVTGYEALDGIRLRAHIDVSTEMSTCMLVRPVWMRRACTSTVSPGATG